MTITITLDQVNQASAAQALALLDGLYEHSPWIATKALEARPFRSLAHLKYVMATVLKDAGNQAQLDLIRAHPELAGKTMRSHSLTAESPTSKIRLG